MAIKTHIAREDTRIAALERSQDFSDAVIVSSFSLCCVALTVLAYRSEGFVIVAVFCALAAAYNI